MWFAEDVSRLWPARCAVCIIARTSGAELARLRWTKDDRRRRPVVCKSHDRVVRGLGLLDDELGGAGDREADMGDSTCDHDLRYTRPWWETNDPHQYKSAVYHKERSRRPCRLYRMAHEGISEGDG